MTTPATAEIIQGETEGYRFCYNYILYYLSAKKISEVIHTSDGKKILGKLFDNLHQERNANILVFITHHSKDISFIESSLLSMMEVLENTKPITLEKTDPFYAEISAFITGLKNDYLENRNPKQERDNALIEQDKKSRENAQRQKEIEEDEDEETKKKIMPFLRSFRSIEIVGQILKNRKGSLEIPQMKDMLSELYTTGFRTVGYYGELLESLKKEVMEVVKDKTDEDDGKKDIEDKINDFIQMTSFKMMLNVFVKLMHSIGNKELKKLYLDVANQINTPAAKIITFSINSYHGVINPKELSDLVDEFKGNIVAMNLLKARVAAYVYNRHVEFDTKQKLASILKMTLAPHARLGNRMDR